eukprot:8181663-Lingulodinium_polyedra.AAC.2
MRNRENRAPIQCNCIVAQNYAALVQNLASSLATVGTNWVADVYGSTRRETGGEQALLFQANVARPPVWAGSLENRRGGNKKRKQRNASRAAPTQFPTGAFTLASAGLHTRGPRAKSTRVKLLGANNFGVAPARNPNCIWLRARATANLPGLCICCPGAGNCPGPGSPLNLGNVNPLTGARRFGVCPAARLQT